MRFSGSLDLTYRLEQSDDYVASWRFLLATLSRSRISPAINIKTSIIVTFIGKLSFYFIYHFTANFLKSVLLCHGIKITTRNATIVRRYNFDF